MDWIFPGSVKFIPFLKYSISYGLTKSEGDAGSDPSARTKELGVSWKLRKFPQKPEKTCYFL
jgi:hypothetical protein